MPPDPRGSKLPSSRLAGRIVWATVFELYPAAPGSALRALVQRRARPARYITATRLILIINTLLESPSDPPPHLPPGRIVRGKRRPPVIDMIATLAAITRGGDHAHHDTSTAEHALRRIEHDTGPGDPSRVRG